MAGDYRPGSAPVLRSGQPDTYQQGVPYEPPLMTADILAGQDIPNGPEIGGGQGEVAAVVNVRGLGPIVIRAPSTGQLNKLREDPQEINRYLDKRFSEFRGFVDTLYQGMSPTDKAALWTSPIPLLGDAVGLVADAVHYIKDSESRTLANGLLTLMSAAPLVPNKRLMDQADQVKRNIQAWHGSPHRFDRFSMEKIGTGEGAQAYGHGLYFAENREVAEQYANMGKKLPVQPDKAHIYAAKDFLKHEMDPAEGLRSAYPGISDEAIEAAIIEARGGYGPNLYQTTLNVDHEDLLDWDLPLSQQPEKVRKSLSEFEGVNKNKILERLGEGQFTDGFGISRSGSEFIATADNDLFYDQEVFDSFDSAIGWLSPKVEQYAARNSPTGAQIYRSLVESQGGQDAISQAQASNLLRQKGIPGIRYLDGASRNTGDGTRNFVIFDDSLININSIE